MKKIALLLISLCFAIQVQAQNETQNTVSEKKFNSEYVEAIQLIDTSKFCFYNDTLASKNTVVEMATGVLMQCKDTSMTSSFSRMEWVPYKQQ